MSKELDLLSFRRSRALGTDVVLATTAHEAIGEASRLLTIELDAIDRACSRFRFDSEIFELLRAKGVPLRVSQLLFDAVAASVRASVATGGAVDATVGNAVVALGYDRDFAALSRMAPASGLAPSPAIGWWSIELDPERRRISVPPGVLLDLGSTAKALVAERAARRVAESTGAGTIVSLGGDIAVAGDAPKGGWPIGIALGSSGSLSAPRQTVCITSGAIASSSTETRTWNSGGRRVHHIVDPLTGDAASDCWRLASVAAASCVDANSASTAAIVWAEQAPERLAAMGLPARLESAAGEVVSICGWPEDPSRKAITAGATTGLLASAKVIAS